MASISHPGLISDDLLAATRQHQHDARENRTGRTERHADRHRRARQRQRVRGLTGAPLSRHRGVAHRVGNARTGRRRTGSSAAAIGPGSGIRARPTRVAAGVVRRRLLVREAPVGHSARGDLDITHGHRIEALLLTIRERHGSRDDGAPRTGVDHPIRRRDGKVVTDRDQCWRRDRLGRLHGEDERPLGRGVRTHRHTRLGRGDDASRTDRPQNVNSGLEFTAALHRVGKVRVLRDGHRLLGFIDGRPDRRLRRSTHLNRERLADDPHTLVRVKVVDDVRIPVRSRSGLDL